MKKIFLLSSFFILITSCETRKKTHYLNNSKDYPASNISPSRQHIQPNDILKIDVYSSDIKAAVPYNKPGTFNNRVANATLQSLQLEGYLVDDKYSIKFPVIGKISVKNKTLKQLEKSLTNLLDDGGHLREPIVSIRLLNARFTVLGEVRNPGTFTFVDDNLSMLQALGYAGDITIDGVRSEIILIREIDMIRTIYTLDLTDAKTLDNSNFYIKPNDVIIIQPNYKKVKSAGFIGNSSSIASISSLLLSITLLLINN